MLQRLCERLARLYLSGEMAPTEVVDAISRESVDNEDYAALLLSTALAVASDPSGPDRLSGFLTDMLGVLAPSTYLDEFESELA